MDQLKYYCGVFVLLLVLSCSRKSGETKPKNNGTHEVDTPTTTAETNPELLLSKQQLLGKIEVASDSNFALVPLTHASRKNMYLQRATLDAFAQMYAAAKKDGLELKIISAFRSFVHQKSIWEAKWNGQRKVNGQQLNVALPDPEARALKILNYSSMPGSSRHHWGTDLDLNALENSYFEKGQGLKLYHWLQVHAADYGFCQVYSEKERNQRTGYEEEKWHWSYLPLAQEYLKQFNEKIKSSDISGFDGSEVAKEVHIISAYVNGINPACKND